MAPTIGIAIPDSLPGKMGTGFGRDPVVLATEAEGLRWRNLELERELKERKEREEKMVRELEWTKGMLSAVMEAEERLCAQLGELEAEAIAQATEYNRRIKSLSDRLAEAQKIIEDGGTLLKTQGFRSNAYEGEDKVTVNPKPLQILSCTFLRNSDIIKREVLLLHTQPAHSTLSCR